MKRRGRMGAIGCLLASMLLAGAIVPANAAADSTIAVISDQEAEDVIVADQEAEDLVAPSEEDLLSAQAIEGDISFIEQDGTTQTLSGSDFKADLAQVSGDSVTLKDGWYYVSANKTFNNRVEVSGEVQLILGDEVQLDCKKGIHVTNSGSLAIFSETGGTGKLIADASDVESCAGIGGNVGESGAHLVKICSGNVTAKGGVDAAGIGGGERDGGKGGDGGDFIMYGGTCNAHGKEFGAGVGGGNNGNGGTIIVYGGELSAYGGYYTALFYEGGGAGIGGGMASEFASGGDGATVIISNSTVEAYSTGGGAGIGGGGGEPRSFGYGGDGGTVTIKDDSTVYVNTKTNDESEPGWAIGAGNDGDNTKGSVSLYDGAVVIQDPDGANSKFATENDRIKYCRESKVIKIEPCKHVNATYSKSATGHTLQCAYCKADDGTKEPHVFDGDNYCVTCGYHLNAPHFKRANLVLGERIGLTFWADLPTLVGVDYGDAYVELSVGGKRAHEACGGR